MERTSTTEFQAPGKTKGQSFEDTKEEDKYEYLAYCSNFALSATVPYCVILLIFCICTKRKLRYLHVELVREVRLNCSSSKCKFKE
jgi:hypothetical protein